MPSNACVPKNNLIRIVKEIVLVVDCPNSSTLHQGNVKHVPTPLFTILINRSVWPVLLISQLLLDCNVLDVNLDLSTIQIPLNANAQVKLPIPMEQLVLLVNFHLFGTLEPCNAKHVPMEQFLMKLLETVSHALNLHQSS